VVLVLLATVVLWRVLGKVEEAPLKPESVIIVGESASGTVSSSPSLPAEELEAAPVEASHAGATALPESLASANTPVRAAADASAPGARPGSPNRAIAAAAPKPDRVQPALKPPEPPAVKPRKKAADPAAILAGMTDDTVDHPAAATRGERYEIQLAALSDPLKADALRAKLSTLGVDAHFSKVQTSKGEATRVRVGPFDSRASANAALRKLAHSGVTGIIQGIPAP
jgi:DedD protein